MVSSSACRRVLAAIVLVCATTSVFSQEGLLITEFLAHNTSGLQDEDREYSDWFEIFNNSDEAVNLEGYHLTDSVEDLRQWTFPAVTIGPREFFTIFASGKDRRDPEGPLHTNFRLDKDGEILVLLTPDGSTIVAGFADYSEQVPDASFGLQMDWTSDTLVSDVAPVRAHVPGDNSLGLTWTAPDFDDTGWIEGTQAVGFGGRGDEAAAIMTDVEALMDDITTSVYVRIPFNVKDPGGIDILTLRVRYDDGFAAFLNGELIVMDNVENDELAFNSEADRSHSGRQWQEFGLSEHISTLRPGRNVLALQGLNTSLTSSDLFLLAELLATDIAGVADDDMRYFEVPTPGGPNNDGVSGVAPQPEFSHDSGVFTDVQDLTLTTDLEGAVIRYTTNGTTPTAAATDYTEPISIRGSTIITARVFRDDLLPGIPAQNTFILMDAAVQSFNSNIPLAIALTFGRQISGSCEGAYTDGRFVIIEPGEDGRARIVDSPSFAHKVGFRRRGSSTCGRSKFSFNVETRNEENDEEDTEIFGWPDHADYAMYGPDNFDRALVRNPFVYEISNQVGQYAVRTRFVECFLQMNSGPLRMANYHGLYSFMERNKRGDGRVEIDRLTSQDNAEPEVSGGYLMKVDRNDGVATISVGGQTIVPVQPKIYTTQQRTWLQAYMNQMRTSLNPNTILDRDGEYVDVRSWIDHHILNMYPMNVDAFRLSGYLFKVRNGPVHMGPVWDYDRTMGSTDGRDANPIDWNGGGTQFFTFGWYNTLFGGRPPTGTTAWQREYIRRWRELRGGPLSTQNISSVIDGMADEIREAATRNFQRWGGSRPRGGPPPLNGTFQGEVDHLKNWLRRRAEWIDGHFIPVPELVPATSLVEPGAQVTIDSSELATAYYTTDGSDPRNLNTGQPSATAIEYTGPIAIDRPMRVTARTLEGVGLWSGSVEGTYIFSMPKLTVTELNYNPSGPTPEEDPKDQYSSSRMEFIEIKNIDDEPADLFGVHFNRTITFDFSTDGLVQTLAPGEVIVLVDDPGAFAARYGTEGITIGGVYPRGTFSNTGEMVRIHAATGAPILEFSYDDGWFPETDGEGFTLVNVNPDDKSADLNDPSNWSASAEPNGNPGVDLAGVAGGLRRPGDFNSDGFLNISDAVSVLRYLFAGAGLTLPCGDDAEASGQAIIDVDGNSAVELSDALYTLQFLFLEGPEPMLGTRCVRFAGCDEACSD